jgi:nicotinamidase-related amidase
MNSALLIIDMQKDFFKKKELAEKQEFLVRNINELIDKFRKNTLPIVFIKQTWKPNLDDAHPVNRKSGKKLVIKGTEGNELVDGLDYNENDHLIIKKRYSGFFKTNLSDILNKLNINKLFVCGINTHACVRMTIIDAYQRDYELVVAEDCVGSYDKVHHDVSMSYFEPAIAEVMSNKEILDILSRRS